MAIQRGDIIRAPWRIYGDDENLTGEVISVTKQGIRVRWHNDGDVTPAGDESLFQPNGTDGEGQPLEVVGHAG